MDRETKFRLTLLLTAAAITAAVLIGLYSVQPIQFYQVVVSATPAPESTGEVSAVPAEASPTPLYVAVGTPFPEEELEEPDPEGPQEVLVEKSININTATLEELDLLPGVGPAIAQRIIDYREANSGFYDIEEIMEVSGIGEKTFQKLEPYIISESFIKKRRASFWETLRFLFLILYAKSLGKAIPACFRACSIKVDTAKLSWLQR